MSAKYLHVAALSLAIVMIQLFTYVTGTTYFLTQLTMSAYYSLVIIGLCLFMGYAGQISLGHAGFFAMGGYISAVLTTHNLLPYREGFAVGLLEKSGALVLRQGLYGDEILHLHPWAACLVAVLFTMLVAYVVGGPVLRLKGHYLAMATLGFGIIIYGIVVGTGLFGAADGVSDVPGFRVIGGLEVSGRLSGRVQNYYIAWGLVVLGMLALLNLIDSRVGRALRSIHGAEDAANAMGVNTSWYKINTFVLSAAFASLAGVLLTHYNGGIGPSEASVMKSVRYVAIVAVGGMANIWGALFMGIVLNFLSLRGYFGSLDDAVFGMILIGVMLFAPHGLLRREMLGSWRKVLSRDRGEEEAV